MPISVLYIYAEQRLQQGCWGYHVPLLQHHLPHHLQATGRNHRQNAEHFQFMQFTSTKYCQWLVLHNKDFWIVYWPCLCYCVLDCLLINLLKESPTSSSTFTAIYPFLLMYQMFISYTGVHSNVLSINMALLKSSVWRCTLGLTLTTDILF